VWFGCYWLITGSYVCPSSSPGINRLRANLITRFYKYQDSKSVELYLHVPIRLHGVVIRHTGNFTFSFSSLLYLSFVIIYKLLFPPSPGFFHIHNRFSLPLSHSNRGPGRTQQHTFDHSSVKMMKCRGN
jgi:hypothetical protein